MALPRNHGSSATRTALRTILLVACCLGASACTSLGGVDARPSAPRAQDAESARPSTRATPSRPQSSASGASRALLEQSRGERAAGSYGQATASIEHALRIDPNNAELWVERGELELMTGNAAQAASMARKALTLAGDDTAIARRAERLLRAAD